MKICGKALPPRAALLLSFDFFLLVIAFPLLFTLPAFVASPLLSPFEFWAAVARLMCAGLFCEAVFYYNELYNLQMIRHTGAAIARVLQAFSMLFLLLAAFYWITPHAAPGLDRILIPASVLLLVVIATRIFALPRRQERVVIVSTGAESADLLEVVTTCPEWNMKVVQVLHPDRVLGSVSEFAGTADVSSVCDRMIVCETRASDRRLLHTLLEWKMKGLRIEDAHSFYERATGRVRVDHLQPDWFVFSTGFENGKRKRMIKRVCDLVIASLLLAITLPVIAVVALAICVEGGGAVLFKQERIGVNGRPFRIFKFRTMRPAGSDQGARWASGDDDRITRLGRVLRTYRLDELPQLWNVLKGEMSLVGPRPEQPYFCSILTENIPYYAQRHAVPPGITGWAQVRYHYGASIEESKRKLEFDLFYVKHLSLWLDFAILIETVKVVLVGRGSK